MSLEQKLKKAYEDPKRDMKERVKILTMTRAGVERDLKFYFAFSGLNLNDIGKDELILDVGSGVANFAKKMREKGITVIALDRSYEMPEGELMLKYEKFSEKVRRIFRGEKKDIPSALAALAEELPFKEETFSRLFYIYSAFNYSSSPEQAKKMFDEGLRVLKRGGSMHIYPIGYDYKSDKYSLLSNINLNDSENEKMSKEFFRYVALLGKTGKIEVEKAYPEVKSRYRDETSEQDLHTYRMTVKKL